MSNVPLTPKTEPTAENQFLQDHVARLHQSYQRLVGKTFGPVDLQGIEFAQAVYKSSFILLSHGTESEPIFNYANLTAQRLFEMSWAEFCTCPSRDSAEPQNQAGRQKLLTAVREQGFFENYQGIRIAKSGKRFWIRETTIWNVTDEQGQYFGQAAICRHWEAL